MIKFKIVDRISNFEIERKKKKFPCPRKASYCWRKEREGRECIFKVKNESENSYAQNIQ